MLLMAVTTWNLYKRPGQCTTIPLRAVRRVITKRDLLARLEQQERSKRRVEESRRHLQEERPTGAVCGAAAMGR